MTYAGERDWVISFGGGGGRDFVRESPAPKSGEKNLWKWAGKQFGGGGERKSYASKTSGGEESPHHLLQRVTHRCVGLIIRGGRHKCA